MKKTWKVLSFIFVLVLLATLGCVATFAADPAPVAQIGDKTYATVAEANAAVKAGETIKLLANFDGDIVLTDDQVTAKVVVADKVTFSGKISYVITTEEKAKAHADITLRKGDVLTYNSKVLTAPVAMTAHFYEDAECYAIGVVEYSSADSSKVYGTDAWAPALNAPHANVDQYDANVLTIKIVATGTSAPANAPTTPAHVPGANVFTGLDFEAEVFDKETNTWVVLAKGWLIEGENPAWGSLTVTKGNIKNNYGDADINLTYNFAEQDFSANAPVAGNFGANGEAVTVKFMDDKGAYTLDKPAKVKNAGTYTIKYQVTSANYNALNSEFDVVVDQLIISTQTGVRYLTVSLDKTSAVYTGKAITVKPVYTYNGGEALKGINADLTATLTATNVGEYTVTVNGLDNGAKNFKYLTAKNEKEETIILNQVVLKWNITKAQAAFKKDIAGWTYGAFKTEVTATLGKDANALGDDEIKIEVSTAAGVVATATMADTSALNAVPVGTYTVKMSIDGTDNYDGATLSAANIAVAKASTETLTMILENVLGSADVKGYIYKNFNFKADAIEAIEEKATAFGNYPEEYTDLVIAGNDMINAGDYKFTVTITFNNYDTVAVEVAAKVNPFKVSVSTPSDVNLIYSSEAQTAEGTWAVTPIDTIPTFGKDEVVYFSLDIIKAGLFTGTAQFTTVDMVDGKTVENKITNFASIENKNYAITWNYGSLKVNPYVLELQLNASTTVFNYDASEKTSTVSFTTVPQLLEYDEGSITVVNMTKGTNAGKYYVNTTNFEVSGVRKGTEDKIAACYTIKLMEGDKEVSEVVAFTIAPAKVNLTLKAGSVAKQEVTYGVAVAKELEFKCELFGEDTLNYTVNYGGYLFKDATAHTNKAGTYAITVKLGENKNYEVTVPTDLSIVVAKATFGAWTDKIPAINYDGKAHEYTLPVPSADQYAGLPAGATPVLVHKDAKGNVIPDGKVSVTKAGTYNYTLTISVENYTDVVLDIFIKINPKADAAIVVDVTVPTYNNTVQDVVINSVKIGDVVFAEGEYKITGVTEATNAGEYEFNVEILSGDYAGSKTTKKWTLRKYVITNMVYQGGHDYVWTKDAPANFYGLASDVVGAAGDVTILLDWASQVGDWTAQAAGVEESDHYIASNYEVAILETIYYTITEKATTFKFTAASGTINDTYSLNFKIPTDAIDQYPFKVTLTREDGVKIVFTDTKDLPVDGNRYVFAFDSIAPSNIDMKITATLEIEGKVINPITHSMISYCDYLWKNSTPDSTVGHIVAAMLRYGIAAEDYVGEAVHGITLPEKAPDTTKPSYTSVAAASIYDKKVVTGHSIGLFLDNGVTMSYKFTLAAGVDTKTIKATVDGQEVKVVYDGSDAIVEIPVSLFECSDKIQIRIYTVAKDKADVLVSGANYSVETYLRFADETSTTYAMVKALVDLGYWIKMGQ